MQDTIPVIAHAIQLAIAPVFLLTGIAGLISTWTHLPEMPWVYRRYDTPDSSTNVPLLGILVAGAGWHNNHQRHAASARAGLAWWEIDLSYYVLRALSALHVIGHLRRQVQDDILREGEIGARLRHREG